MTTASLSKSSKQLDCTPRAARDQRSLPELLLRESRKSCCFALSQAEERQQERRILPDRYLRHPPPRRQESHRGAGGDAEDVLAVNTRQQLAEVDAIMQDRIQRQLRDSGVTIVSADEHVHRSRRDHRAGHGDSAVHASSAAIASIGADCVIGPFASCRAKASCPKARRSREMCVGSRRPWLSSVAIESERDLQLTANDLCSKPTPTNSRSSPAGPTRSWRRRSANISSIPLGRGRTELFPDGELIVKVEEDVRGRDCFIVQPT